MNDNCIVSFIKELPKSAYFLVVGLLFGNILKGPYHLYGSSFFITDNNTLCSDNPLCFIICPYNPVFNIIKTIAADCIFKGLFYPFQFLRVNQAIKLFNRYNR